MRIRTIDQLLDRVSNERVWRIREIIALRSQCFAPGLSGHVAKALRRSFIPIAYAHWEGFTKKTANYYLEFVAMQGLQLGELNSAFVSLYLWKECATSLARGKAFSLVEVCEALLSRRNQQVRLQYKDVISTNSNLDSKTLSDICSTLGLSFRNFETKALFIDAKLVGKRNHIAHGEEQYIGEDDLEEIKTEVVLLIDLFRNEVENAVTSNAFKSAL
jgi:MAE_28990/MAE_18760-like HEPN